MARCVALALTTNRCSVLTWHDQIKALTPNKSNSRPTAKATVDDLKSHHSVVGTRAQRSLQRNVIEHRLCLCQKQVEQLSATFPQADKHLDLLDIDKSIEALRDALIQRRADLYGIRYDGPQYDISDTHVAEASRFATESPLIPCHCH